MSSGLSEPCAGVRGGVPRAEDTVDFAGNVALEASDDLGFGLALGESTSHVGPGRFVPAQADHGDSMQGCVGLPVAAPVEPVTVGLARGRRDRVRPAEGGECRLAAQAVGVVPCGHEEPGGAVRADPEHLEELRCGDGGKCADLFLEFADLDAKLEVASR